MFGWTWDKKLPISYWTGGQYLEFYVHSSNPALCLPLPCSVSLSGQHSIHSTKWLKAGWFHSQGTCEPGNKSYFIIHRKPFNKRQRWGNDAYYGGTDKWHKCILVIYQAEERDSRKKATRRWLSNVWQGCLNTMRQNLFPLEINLELILWSFPRINNVFIDLKISVMANRRA